MHLHFRCITNIFYWLEINYRKYQYHKGFAVLRRACTVRNFQFPYYPMVDGFSFTVNASTQVLSRYGILQEMDGYTLSAPSQETPFTFINESVYKNSKCDCNGVVTHCRYFLEHLVITAVKYNKINMAGLLSFLRATFLAPETVLLVTEDIVYY